MGRHLGASLSVLTWLVICVCLRVYHCLSWEIAYPTRGRDRVCFPVFLALSLGPFPLCEHSVNSKWMNQFLFASCLPCLPVTQTTLCFRPSSNDPTAYSGASRLNLYLLYWHLIRVLYWALAGSPFLPAGECLWDPQQMAGPAPTFPDRMFSLSVMDLTWRNRGPIWLLPLLELQRQPRGKKKVYFRKLFCIVSKYVLFRLKLMNGWTPKDMFSFLPLKKMS